MPMISIPEGHLRPARAAEALRVYNLHRAAASGLDRRFGRGPWSHISLALTLRRVLFSKTVHVFEQGDRIVGAFTLLPEKIDFYEEHWFSPGAAPALYLRSMSVAPEVQRHGIGRAMVLAGLDVARAGGFKALRLDAYQAAGGAAGFYLKCGFSKVASGIFQGVALDVFEKRV